MNYSDKLLLDVLKNSKKVEKKYPEIDEDERFRKRRKLVLKGKI